MVPINPPEPWVPPTPMPTPLNAQDNNAEPVAGSPSSKAVPPPSTSHSLTPNKRCLHCYEEVTPLELQKARVTHFECAAQLTANLEALRTELGQSKQDVHDLRRKLKAIETQLEQSENNSTAAELRLRELRATLKELRDFMDEEN